MTPNPSAVADARRRAGLSQQQVAERMRRRGLPGTHWHWVHMLERGLWEDVPAIWLATLAAVVGAPLPDIISGPWLAAISQPGSPAPPSLRQRGHLLLVVSNP
jgi:hypothetical protein